MKIKFRHYREISDDGVVNSRGGATLAFMQDTDGSFLGSVAYCSPRDNYNKGYGRAKAGGKLFKHDKDDTTIMGSQRHFHSSVKVAADFIEEMDSYMSMEEGYSPR